MSRRAWPSSCQLSPPSSKSSLVLMNVVVVSKGHRGRVVHGERGEREGCGRNVRRQVGGTTQGSRCPHPPGEESSSKLRSKVPGHALRMVRRSSGSAFLVVAGGRGNVCRDGGKRNTKSEPPPRPAGLPSRPQHRRGGFKVLCRCPSTIIFEDAFSSTLSPYAAPAKSKSLEAVAWYSTLP